MDKKHIGTIAGLGTLVVGLGIYLVKGNDPKFKEVLKKTSEAFKKPFVKAK